MFGFDEGDVVEVRNERTGRPEGKATITGFDDSPEDGPRVFVQFHGSFVGADPHPDYVRKVDP